MPRDLPVFPLPLVLFPGATQPLHIFEPRYRRLLADALESDRRFGIAYAPPDAGPDPAPRPGDVGCIARILSSTPLPDGRADIVTTGEDRFVLLAWLDSDRPYRMARVEPFADDAPDPGEAGGLAATVRRDFLRVVAAVEHEAPPLPLDPEALSFRVAAALELDPPGKLAFLAGRSTTDRLRRLAALLPPLAADAERRSEVRHRGKANGQGGAHPRIERVP